jgi:hypothetical protein
VGGKKQVDRLAGYKMPGKMEFVNPMMDTGLDSEEESEESQDAEQGGGRLAQDDDAHKAWQGGAKKAVKKRYTGGEVNNPMLEGGSSAALVQESFLEVAKIAEQKRPQANKLSDVQWLKLFAGVFMPMIDSWSDWAVTISWYVDGETWWFGLGIAIMVFSGLVSGVVFWRMTMQDRVKHWRSKELSQEIGDLWRATKHMGAQLGCVLLGLIGMVPGAQAYLTLKWDDEGNQSKRDHSKQTIAFLKGMELVVETLGQTCLQVYIGIAFGRLDPASPNFSRTQAFSCILGVVSAGLACFAFESYHRDELSLSSLYGSVTALWRATQTAGAVTALALTGCAFKAWVVIPALLTIALAAYIGAATISVPAYHLWPLNKQVTAKQNTVLGLMAIALIVIQGVFFYKVPHLGNNYADALLPITTNSSLPQHFECSTRSDAVIFCVYCLLGSVCLMSASTTLYEGESLSNLYLFDGSKAESLFLATRLETEMYRAVKSDKAIESKIKKIASYRNTATAAGRHEKLVWIRHLRAELAPRLEERRCKWEDAELKLKKLEDIEELFFPRDNREMYSWREVKDLYRAGKMDDKSLVYSHEASFPYDEWALWGNCKVYFRSHEDEDGDEDPTVDDYQDLARADLFPYEKHDRVRTHDLHRVEFNHLCGEVIHHKPDKDGRYMVALDLHDDKHEDGAVKKLRFKPENLILQSHRDAGSVRLRFTMADLERRCKSYEQRIEKLYALMDSIEGGRQEDGEGSGRYAADRTRITGRIRVLQLRIARGSSLVTGSQSSGSGLATLAATL